MKRLRRWIVRQLTPSVRVEGHAPHKLPLGEGLVHQFQIERGSYNQFYICLCMADGMEWNRAIDPHQLRDWLNYHLGGIEVEHLSED